jgi:hypothetical protein
MQYGASDKILVLGEGGVVTIPGDGGKVVEGAGESTKTGETASISGAQYWTKLGNKVPEARDSASEQYGTLELTEVQSRFAGRADGLHAGFKTASYASMAEGLKSRPIQRSTSFRTDGKALYS